MQFHFKPFLLLSPSYTSLTRHLPGQPPPNEEWEGRGVQKTTSTTPAPASRDALRLSRTLTKGRAVGVKTLLLTFQSSFNLPPFSSAEAQTHEDACKQTLVRSLSRSVSQHFLIQVHAHKQAGRDDCVFQR